MLTETDWLPVGSVVLLEGGTRPIVIIGYYAWDEETSTLWDYVGVPYPWGSTDNTDDYYFDRSMVTAIYMVGYVNNEVISLLEMISVMGDSRTDDPFATLRELGIIDIDDNL